MLPDRGRWRNAVNLLLCMAAVAGVLVGGWSMLDTYETRKHRAESRRVIGEACAGLADADEVMRLDGGADRLGISGLNPEIIDIEGLPDRCELGRVGVKAGKDYFRSHFTLAVRALPQADPLHVLDTFLDESPFVRRVSGDDADITARTRIEQRHPLGDGSAGDYDSSAVAVTVRCAAPAEGGTTAIRASAIADYAAGTTTAADRRRLSRLARTAAGRAAAEVGCATSVPELPADLPVPARDLGSATGRQDSCGWYAEYLRGQDRGRLPDRALGVPVAAASRQESCLLAVGPSEVKRIFPQLTEEERGRASLREVLTSSPWWIRTRAFFEEEAAVAYKETRYPTQIDPGEAGHKGQLRWATATCQGRPAVFTLSAGEFRYSRMVESRLAALFTAYAEHTAARRGCVNLVLPGAG
ncbi:hypothetical protein [Streptomyces sp. NPDC051211]|uniref:hypothetical protein n=1 Tax=Streptomyces sp. NPDC051211 TaxID=3154643 RepID=UPI00344DBD8F